ncbi:MAG: hypothetical protein M0Q38_06405 [Bacteroidales bacterium]|jgi:hypothetical protein|nr:hypothetical protein [Bacteroidales bacterium]
MAKLPKDSIFHGFSGKLGDMVFRHCNGVTIISKAPRRPKKVSSEQKLQRFRFRMAAAYASEMMRDPCAAARFRAKAGKGITAYNLAIKEYFEKDTM